MSRPNFFEVVSRPIDGETKKIELADPEAGSSVGVYLAKVFVSIICGFVGVAVFVPVASLLDPEPYTMLNHVLMAVSLVFGFGAGVGGWWLVRWGVDVAANSVELTRRKGQISGYGDKKFAIGSDPVVVVRRIEVQRGRSRATGYELYWFPDGRVEELDVEGTESNQLHFDPDCGTPVIEFSEDPVKVRRFAEGLCKLGEASMIWKSPGSPPIRRDAAHLDAAVTKRWSVEELPAVPDEQNLDSVIAIQKTQDEKGIEIRWRSLPFEYVIKATGLASACGLIIGALLAQTEPFRVGTVSGGVLGAFGLAAFIFAMAGGFKLQQWLADRTTRVTPKILSEHVCWLGIFATDKVYDTADIESVHLPDGRRVVVVGDHLREPIGWRIWDARTARSVRLVILYALLGSTNWQ